MREVALFLRLRLNIGRGLARYRWKVCEHPLDRSEGQRLIPERMYVHLVPCVLDSMLWSIFSEAGL